jgi:hypothetical protein
VNINPWQTRRRFPVREQSKTSEVDVAPLSGWWVGDLDGHGASPGAVGLPPRNGPGARGGTATPFPESNMPTLGDRELMLEPLLDLLVFGENNNRQASPWPVGAVRANPVDHPAGHFVAQLDLAAGAVHPKLHGSPRCSA